MPLTQKPLSGRSKALLIGLVSLTLVTVVTALLRLSLQVVHGPVQALPHGTRVELAGVTYGKHHEHRVGNFWQRLAGQRPQPPIVTPIGNAAALTLTLSPFAADHPDPIGTPTDSLVLWQRTSPGPGDTLDLWSAAVIDDHGCRVRCVPEGWYNYLWYNYFRGWNPSVSAPSNLQPLRLLAFPRRSDAFRYALVPDNAPDVVFNLRTPQRKQFPNWNAPPYPVVASHERTRFVLKRLEHFGERKPFSQATAYFDYFESDRPVSHWRPERLTVFDATGNKVTTSGSSEPADRFTFDALCRLEPAWKLRLFFVRDAPVGAPSYQWTERNIEVPERGSGIHYGPPARKLGGLTLGVTKFSGGTNVQAPGIWVTAHGPGDRYQLALIRVSDERGRVIPVGADLAIQLIHGGGELEFYLSRYPSGSKRLNLTFGIYPIRSVEFLIKP